MVEEENAKNSSSSIKKPTLNEEILQISSLISLSHTITVFTAKWQTIRTKLEELFSNLAAIDNCERSANSSISAAAESISATLENCSDLARRCSEFSYAGKLLMQSDLDVLSAKLDVHIENLRDIYAARLLTQSYAIVVSRPSSSASNDDVKFYLNDVVSRLKIGSSEMKRQALVSFSEVIEEDERFVNIAIEIDGLVSSVVNLLDFEDGDVKEEAARATSLISRFDSCKSVVISAGVIAPLVRVVESGSEMSKEFALRCLMKMTENSDNVWAVSAHGGVTALLKICCDHDGNGQENFETICLSCTVLKNLVGVDEIKRFVVEEEGAIKGLIDLARSKCEAAKIASLDLLQTMAYKDESIREMIIKLGLIRVLVQIFDPKSSLTTKTREMAFKVITNICFPSRTLISTMISYGFMDHILCFLRFGEASSQELFLKAAFWFCGTSVEAKKAMGEAGFMPVLVKFLDSRLLEMREMAAETLCSMMVVSKNKKKFVQSDQNVAVLMQMLDVDEVKSCNKKVLLSLLMLLASSNGGRRKILSSGYLRNVEKLAEAEVGDAKKIVKKLCSSRLRNVLNVLWYS